MRRSEEEEEEELHGLPVQTGRRLARRRRLPVSTAPAPPDTAVSAGTGRGGDHSEHLLHLLLHLLQQLLHLFLLFLLLLHLLLLRLGAARRSDTSCSGQTPAGGAAACIVTRQNGRDCSAARRDCSDDAARVQSVEGGRDG